MPKKEITIYKLHLCSYDDEKIVFDVHCSRGTYVRTIGEDIAQELVPCWLFVRVGREIASGQFTQEQAISDLRTYLMLITDNDSQDLLSTLEENIVAIQSLFPFQTFEVEAAKMASKITVANGQRLTNPFFCTSYTSNRPELILMHKNKICALGQREERCFDAFIFVCLFECLNYSSGKKVYSFRSCCCNELTIFVCVSHIV